uniref:Uncharacterized protein n=1 Tax=Panagrolaimus davidi TaxID=227884 RepID=A0A914QYQ2_9BILA
MKIQIFLFFFFLVLFNGGESFRLRRQIVTGQSAVATPDGGVASIPAGSVVVPPSDPSPGIQTDMNRDTVVALPGGGLQNIGRGNKIVPGK